MQGASSSFLEGVYNSIGLRQGVAVRDRINMNKYRSKWWSDDHQFYSLCNTYELGSAIALIYWLLIFFVLEQHWTQLFATPSLQPRDGPAWPLAQAGIHSHHWMDADGDTMSRNNFCCRMRTVAARRLCCSRDVYNALLCSTVSSLVVRVGCIFAINVAWCISAMLFVHAHVAVSSFSNGGRAFRRLFVLLRKAKYSTCRT